MKILILSIYNETEIYNEMLKIQRKYYDLFKETKNIEIYFIQFRKEQDNYVEIEDDFIYIKGEEKLLNIMEKTINALDYLINKLNNKYDFIIRTNISTIVNIKNLLIFLSTQNKNNLYTGGTNTKLYWLDISSGITRKNQIKYKLKNFSYIQGNAIIFSYDIIYFIINNKNKINYEIVDDVSFGLFIRNFFPDVYNNINLSPNVARIVYNTFCEDAVFIRNKNNNRNIDIENIDKFINIIISNSL